MKHTLAEDSTATIVNLVLFITKDTYSGGTFCRVKAYLHDKIIINEKIE